MISYLKGIVLHKTQSSVMVLYGALEIDNTLWENEI